MAPTKRKVAAEDTSSVPAPAKRQKRTVEPSTRTTRSSLSTPKSTRASSTSKPSSAVKNGAGRPRTKTTAKDSTDDAPKPGPKSKTAKARSSTNGTPKETNPKSKTTKGRKKPAKPVAEKKKTANANMKIAIDVPENKKSASQAKIDHDKEFEEHDDGPAFWLMKAEPESRIEKGKDVKFSIDDLKGATEPEGWDGVRNAVARNNMRLMMKGDLAFFYHSNCKVPGIVGTMEVVREHSTDETAFDPEHPYYDEKSDREKPKWCLVHVEFRQKFPEIIKLKDLQKYGKDGGILEHMQVLKQSRLSVSKVTKKEWEFIMSLVDVEDVAAAAAQYQPQMVDPAPS